ncbi:LOW QUALITY PROTEIN: puromycin-sensitive aminopeptidase [Galendromus occidentalis]|uniref:Aminopeptidase n=1 Tax=Galendromus occidentalis TaxID=34638 RepID=A0AAJ7SIR1_9ACAR|nr:LOW QUALITY PROTEIN: puromycin-sensitive aminopeptidase [Galendromus occidentalis]
MTKRSFKRLPRSIIPKNYVITLKTDFQKSVCPGSVKISLEIVETTSVILLDALDLKIQTCSLELADGAISKPKEIRLMPEDGRLELSFEQNLPLGSCALSIEFEGEINTSLRGFYKTTPKGELQAIPEAHGVTQFAATEARRCFPCWDEPSFKATFELTLIVPQHLQTLSNMDAEETTTLDDGLKKIRHPKTPKMSSYLVAFAIGKYDFLESSTKSNVRVRVYAPKGMGELGDFALKFAVKSLEFYEDYFSIPYPLPKLDLLAVNDFAYGAMENWGLVIFRQSRLLFDELRSDSSTREDVSLVVAHELAHQWFGNIVTMEWWTHLWLNEGFAQFMEILCTQAISPELGVWSQLSLELNTALTLDALDSSHPIEVPIHHPSEIDEIFDRISYSKGSAIISMLYHHIGDEKFRKGMARYLNKHEYGNAQTEDLWHALQTPEESSVLDLMQPWTSQMGFPQLSVKMVDGDLLISQEKFYSTAENAQKAVIKPTWKVPVSIATNASAAPIRVVLENDSTTVKLPTGVEWVHVNSGGTGVFRTLYEESMFNNLLVALKNKELTNDRDRFVIHADLSAQVAANYRSSAQLLQLTSILSDDESYIVWVSIRGALRELALVYQTDRDLHESIARFARQVFSKIFALLGWDESPKDDHCRALLRTLVIDALIGFDDRDVIAEAAKRFRDSLAGEASLSGNLKAAAYRGFAKSGDKTVWDTLWQMFRTAGMQEDEVKILLALGSSNDEGTIQKLLDSNLTDEIRSQQGPQVIRAIAQTSKGLPMLWQHYTKWHEKYNERFNAGILLPAFIKALTGSFSTESMASEIRSFFEKNPLSGTERSLLQSREEILRRAAWRDRDEQSLRNFFSKPPSNL